ncbi:hypothetical protein D3C72_2253840 [compost metagenome]
MSNGDGWIGTMTRSTFFTSARSRLPSSPAGLSRITTWVSFGGLARPSIICQPWIAGAAGGRCASQLSDDCCLSISPSITLVDCDA